MPTYRDKVTADGATAYWRLGEASGTITKSEVGNFDGTIASGVTLGQPGALSDGNRAMRFNGGATPTDRISVAQGSYGTVGTGPFSIELWFNSTSLATFQHIFDSGGSNTAQIGWNVFLNAGGGYIGIRVSAGGGLTFLVTLNEMAPSVWTNGQWHHLVAVITRGGTDNLTPYLDGVGYAPRAITAAGWNLTPNQSLYLGSLFNGGPSGLAALDEVAIYPTALTPAQIADHYAARLLPAADAVPYAPVVLPAAKPPHTQWTPLTPSDIVDSPFSALWVGGAGTVAAVGLDGRVVPFTGVQAGTRLRVSGRRVNDTGTTATNLLALGRT